jgi:hypothetical protein
MSETILSDSEDRRLTWRQQRRFVRIPEASAYSGFKPQQLYEEAGRHEGLFRKNGVITLCDLSILDSILDSLPVAEVKKVAPRVYAPKKPRNQYQNEGGPPAHRKRTRAATREEIT